MNSVNLIGRITRDPELKTSANGKAFVAFTIAVNEYSNGNQYTQFVPCFAWEKTAENMNKYVKKGAQVGVSGSINVRQNNGNGQIQTIVTVNAQRVEFLSGTNTGSSSFESDSDNRTSFSQNSQTNDFSNNPANGDNIDIDADAILFED